MCGGRKPHAKAPSRKGVQGCKGSGEWFAELSEGEDGKDVEGGKGTIRSKLPKVTKLPVTKWTPCLRAELEGSKESVE